MDACGGGGDWETACGVRGAGAHGRDTGILKSLQSFGDDAADLGEGVEDAGEDEGRVHSEVCAGLGQRKDRKEGERWMRGRMGLATL